ncbi:MAG TPA: SusC/RagA family TonB-linked outer membrane protein, partial [Draconibacterium sp.]|nr:SusC/RagA family TonB-linked outer membrane protein [Draconibacterium sp.]
MKLTLILLMAGFLQVSATVYSQATKFSFDVKKQRVADVLREIEDQSDFRFFYQREQVDVEQRVSLNITDQTVEEILPELFKGQDVVFDVRQDNLILIKPEKNNIESSTEFYAQQQKSVSGKVTDSSGLPLPGVALVVKGTTVGTVTNANGEYTLSNIPEDAVIQFSFVGMRPQEIVVGNQTIINVAMVEETIGIEEVVAIGYGTVKKSDLTGSVASISSERLLDKPAFNVSQAISGKVAGVKIIERTGAPGGQPMIRVRGTNSINTDNNPLVVVDGVVGVKNALTILNPNEIESLEVLKDASATAIYGARGANGVIMITTKRGNVGDIKVEYDGYVSMGTLQKNLPALNAEEFLYVYQQAWKNINKYAKTPNWALCVDASMLPADRLASAKTYSEYTHLFTQTTPGGYSVPLMGKDGNYYAPRFDTDWEAKIFVPSYSTNHQFSVRGGSEKARLGAFLGYAFEDGLLVNSDFGRYSGRVTGDFKVAKWLDISTQIGITKSKEQTNDVSYFSGGISRGVVEAFPIIPPEYPNDPSTYGSYSGIYGRNLHFPVGEVDAQAPWHVSQTAERFTDRSQWTGNILLDFKITSDLSFKTTFAADDNWQKYNAYGGREVTRGDVGNAEIQTRSSFYWQSENYFNYNKTIGDHAITGLLGATWSRYSWEDLNAYNRNFFDDFYKWHNIGVGTYTRPAPSSSDGKNSLNSYYIRGNYSYKSKYLATFTGRMDGSSKFGENSKYGFFPSGSVAWRITEEDFMDDVSYVSNLKLRLSAGQTGNQEIGSYVTQAFIGSTNVAIGGAVQPGLYPSSMAATDLGWETTTQYNGGIDLGLWDNRVAMSLDYYHKTTDDMLLDVPLPTST